MSDMTVENLEKQVAELEERVLQLKDEVGDEWARAEQAESELAAMRVVLRNIADETILFADAVRSGSPAAAKRAPMSDQSIERGEG